MSDFIKDYIFQTRREIDTEKHSRDNILNVIVLVLGAVGFAMFRSEDPILLLEQPAALVIEACILVTVTGLFWLRWKKLQQIADRWFVLYNLLQHHLIELPLNESMEAIVEPGLRSRRYTEKDFLLCVMVSCPVYGLFILGLKNNFSQWPILSLLFVLSHIIVCAALMLRPFKWPEPLATAREQKRQFTKKSVYAG